MSSDIPGVVRVGKGPLDFRKNDPCERGRCRFPYKRVDAGDYRIPLPCGSVWQCGACSRQWRVVKVHGTARSFFTYTRQRWYHNLLDALKNRDTK